MDSNDPVAIELVQAIHTGDTGTLRRLLVEHPGLASEPIHDRRGSKTPLLAATDWPGYFPGGPAVVRMLIDAGADPNHTTGSGQPESPLHWAASSDDADVAEVLISSGADIEMPGGSIGTPLDNAIGYGCWHVARLLVASGARVDKLWHAAALGMLPRLEELLAATPAPEPADISEAFWQACHGGQRRAAELLLARGADINVTTDHSHGTPLDVAAELSTRRENLTTWLRGHDARTAEQESDVAGSPGAQSA
ncbi:MAG: ankyrin repeat domain-containing protein [Actinomycetota bacterium]